MSDFLSEMMRSSVERLEVARRRTPERVLREKIAAMSPALAIKDGFILIAEVKKVSPALGVLESAARSAPVARRAGAYERGGAAAVSVLTEPTRFGGNLEDLAEVSGAVGVPTMRKDFLVDPYQIVQARASGASGVLLIARMLADAQMAELIECARGLGMFTLVEAFDEEDAERLCAAAERFEGGSDEGRPGGTGRVLAGVNCRDLATMKVRPTALASLRMRLPAGLSAIAESGLETESDVAMAARLGYDGVLVGGALMKAADPEETCRRMVSAGTSAARGGLSGAGGDGEDA